MLYYLLYIYIYIYIYIANLPAPQKEFITGKTLRKVLRRMVGPKGDKLNEMRSLYRIVWNPQRKRQNRNLGVDWRIFLKCILETWKYGVWTVLNYRSGPRVYNGFCGNGNEN
jgi:hypothetical protein